MFASLPRLAAFTEGIHDLRHVKHYQQNVYKTAQQWVTDNSKMFIFDIKKGREHYTEYKECPKGVG